MAGAAGSNGTAAARAGQRYTQLHCQPERASPGLSVTASPKLDSQPRLEVQAPLHSRSGRVSLRSLHLPPWLCVACRGQLLRASESLVRRRENFKLEGSQLGPGLSLGRCLACSVHPEVAR